MQAAECENGKPMGLFLKPRISENEAAGIFVSRLYQAVERSWPVIFERVRPTLSDRTSVIDNESAGRREFFLAVVATHLEELERVFDPERAGRIRALIGEALGAAGEGFDAALESYRGRWDEARERGEDPRRAVGALLHERLGATFSAKSSRPERAGAEPLIPLLGILSNFDISWWRYLTQKYRIEKPKRAA